MALTTLENWKVTSYTNDTLTTLVTGAPSVVASLVACNTNAASSVVISVEVNGASIISNYTLTAYSSITLDLRSVVVKTGQTMQVKASAAGVHFTASGSV